MHLRRLTTDLEPGTRADWRRARRAEGHYARQLRKVARQVGALVEGFDPADPLLASKLRHVLGRYAETIRPWAEAVAGRMLADVSAQDEQTWQEMARRMGRALGTEIRTAPTGAAMRALLAEQVDLITSLPTEAAERVQRLAVQGMEAGRRASSLADEIMRSGEVTEGRANLIARTEVGRAASTLTQVRAEHVGSTGYIWRTARDGDVRPSHKKMAGKFVLWADPVTLDGLTGHAGALPNCRCYAEPVIPDEIE